MSVMYLTGARYSREHEKTSDGSIICNPRFRIIPSDWDSRCKDELTTGVGFRITEKGKTDVDLNPGLYSIHSPLYGTDWKDENAFEDRYSCSCGNLIGRRYMDSETVCPVCNTPVRYISTNIRKTGWFVLDRNYIINPGMYFKLGWFVGNQHLYQMTHYIPENERSKYMDNKTSPFYGIGMIEFYERFDEILQWYYHKKKNHEGYEFFRIHRDEIFVHCIPCYNSALRKWMVRNGDIRYSDEDKIFQKLFSDHLLLNDDFEWKRRVDYRVNRKKDMAYLRKENILFRIQGYVNDLWDLSFNSIKRKEGIINEQILGGRLNYTARNVIVPDPELRADHIGLGYTTFLELYKMEIVALIHDLYEMEYPSAWNMLEEASVVYSDRVYKLMVHLMTRNNLYISIDRNPSINFGSYATMQVAKIEPDITDYCMGIPVYVLNKANADFDGDIENIFCHKIGKIGEEYYKRDNPRSNMFVSHNDGHYDMDTAPFKDAIAGLYAYANI